MAAELRVLTPARVAGRIMRVATGANTPPGVGAAARGVRAVLILLALVAATAVSPAHAAPGDKGVVATEMADAAGAVVAAGVVDATDVTARRFAAARGVAGAGERGLVVMLRDRLEIDDELSRRAFSADELARYGAIAGVKLVAVERMRDGAQVLKLPAATSEEVLADVLSALRWQPEVLYAERYDFPAPGARAAVPALPDGPPVTSLMVKLRDPAMRALSDANQPLPVEQMAILSALAGVELGFVRAMSGGAFVVSLPEPLSPTEAAAIAARIAADPAVTWADPNAILELAAVVPDDELLPFQWHYWDSAGGIRAPEAWGITRGSGSIFVAVLDSGILFDHPDLQGAVTNGVDLVYDPSRDLDPSDVGGSHDWHGSHVAATIGANTDDGGGVAGINWTSPLVPVRIAGAGGISPADEIDGIRWAIGKSVPDVPANPYPARVLNLSLGGFGGCLPSEQAAIAEAIAADAVVVVAAGNSGVNAIGVSPANCLGVVTVGATTRTGAEACFSNWGPTLEISAPGGVGAMPCSTGTGKSSCPFDGSLQGGVLSAGNLGTQTPGQNWWTWISGTSMAAPHVAGVASLVLSRNPSLKSEQVREILRATARLFPTGAGNLSSCADGVLTGSMDCQTTFCGSGIVDAYAAVIAAGTPMPSPTPTPTRTPTPTPTRTPTPVPATPTPAATPAGLTLVSPNTVRCGVTNTLTGTGFSPGSVVKAFIAFPSGVQAVGPYVPTSIAPTSLTWTLPCSVGLGNGFIALQVINTDQGYSSSNIVPALLRAGTSSGYPSITGINGVTVTAAHGSFPLAHVQTVVAKGSTITINGTGFAVPAKVNLFSASGNAGPLDTLPGSTSTALLVQIPLAAPTGPGAVQVVNPSGAWPSSNAVSVPLGAAISITSITQVGSTITVNGSGFSTLSVINFFTPSANHCGMAAGAAVCPLALVSDQQFTVQRPSGAGAGRAFIEVLNPPFIPFSSTGTDPDGAFTLP